MNLSRRSRRQRRPLALALAFVFSAAVQPAPAQQAPTTPFTSGITDAVSLKKAIDARMGRANGLLDSMLAVKGPRTVANTLEPYDQLLDELNTASGQVTVMMDLHPDAAVRD